MKKSALATIYVFSFFRNNGEDGLYLAASRDGLIWHEANQGQPLLKPEVGENKLMRDPSLFRAPSGQFHMVWTTSWRGRTLGYASSKDLVTWSAQKEILPFSKETLVSNCWAPELFYDAPTKEYWIVFASTLGAADGKYNHRMYSIRTRDFLTFTRAELFYDPGFQVIDAALFRHAGKTWMVAKNETPEPPAKYLFLSSATSPRGPWASPTASISGPMWAEGPTPLRVGDYWHIYFDRYRDKQYGVIRSRDLQKWEDLSEKLQLPKGLRHGTALAIDAAGAPLLLQTTPR